jgi:hypothetical protein
MMASGRALRFGALIAVTFGCAGGLAAASSPAQASGPRGGGGGGGNCTTTFQDAILPGTDVAAYNYVVCTYANGVWTRTNGPAYIERNGVLVSGSTTGSAPFIGNSGPGYAVYDCNGSTENSFYLYGPGATQRVACG